MQCLQPQKIGARSKERCAFLSPRYYVVVIPAELYHLHKGMLWVHLANLNETVLVTLQLERERPSSNIILLEKKVKEPNLTENALSSVSHRPRAAQPRFRNWEKLESFPLGLQLYPRFSLGDWRAQKMGRNSIGD